ncbi:hypothetical protein GQ54DRAFT_307911 [Martensiomyces pterosporus]|nr:hypothetical protein GQ54DRAFT_307911 [Martensiomyces pterosporus]
MSASTSNRLRHQAGPRSGTPGGYASDYNSPPYGGQAEDEHDPNGKDSRLRSKISMLKEVSISIGDEIRDQNQFLGTMGQDMEGMGGRLSATMKHFYEMWARQGCGPFFYLTLFTLGVFTFLYIYLKAR